MNPEYCQTPNPGKTWCGKNKKKNKNNNPHPKY